MTAPAHVPVLRDEVVAALAPRAGGVYVDGTYGGGGYSRALLEAAPCTVYGIDRDPDAIAAGAADAARYPDRLVLLEGRFGDMAALLGAHGVATVDGVTLDVGVSSMQLDRAERGFSFRHDGPLDMRMERDGRTAAELVNTLDEDELAALIADFGEERHARRIARAIVRARADKPIERTGELAEIVRAALPRQRPDEPGIDPATRTFQALRIVVNDELGELDRGLAAAEALLGPGGRIAVVTFHSLEDRRVKRFLRDRSARRPRPSRHVPDVPGADGAPTFRPLTQRAVRPGEAEVAANPRARSARLRAAERTAAPAGGA